MKYGKNITRSSYYEITCPRCDHIFFHTLRSAKYSTVEPGYTGKVWKCEFCDKEFGIGENDRRVGFHNMERFEDGTGWESIAFYDNYRHQVRERPKQEEVKNETNPST